MVNQELREARSRAVTDMVRSEMLDVLLSAADFDDFVSRLYYATKVSDSDAEAIENVSMVPPGNTPMTNVAK